uniref:Secreted protein n=1 Tax=Mycena chlorophos TaxID=658473 RepID=A0ABQ0KZ98_MYCCL|nr:predicted protein [Mycena chlorophos]
MTLSSWHGLISDSCFLTTTTTTAVHTRLRNFSVVAVLLSSVAAAAEDDLLAAVFSSASTANGFRELRTLASTLVGADILPTLACSFPR